MAIGDGATLVHQSTDAATRLAPTALASGAVFLGYSLNEWVAITAIVYTVLQTFVLARKVWKEWRAKNGG